MLVHLYRIVINDTNQMIPDKVAVVEFLGQRMTCITGTDEHHIAQTGSVGRMEELALHGDPQAIREPDADAAHKAEHKTNHHTGSGHQDTVKVEYRYTDHAHHHVCADDPEHFRSTDEGPDTAVEPKAAENEDHHHAPGAHHGQKALQMDIADICEFKIRPEPQSQEETGYGCNNIQQHDHQDLGCCGDIHITGFFGSHCHHTSKRDIRKGEKRNLPTVLSA